MHGLSCETPAARKRAKMEAGEGKKNAKFWAPHLRASTLRAEALRAPLFLDLGSTFFILSYFFFFLLFSFLFLFIFPFLFDFLNFHFFLLFFKLEEEWANPNPKLFPSWERERERGYCPSPNQLRVPNPTPPSPPPVLTPNRCRRLHAPCSTEAQNKRCVLTLKPLPQVMSQKLECNSKILRRTIFASIQGDSLTSSNSSSSGTMTEVAAPIIYGYRIL